MIKFDWESIKSWWYWKVSSKYDGTDVVMFVGFPIMIVGMIAIAIAGYYEKKEYAAACEAKGGALISTHKRYICIDEKVIIK